MSSTEFVQEREAADENAERNPEMNVAHDRAKQVAGAAVGGDWGHGCLEIGDVYDCGGLPS